MLFWDAILSGDQNVACASCHHPDFGWADGRQFSIGSDGVGLVQLEIFVGKYSWSFSLENNERKGCCTKVAFTAEGD